MKKAALVTRSNPNPGLRDGMFGTGSTRQRVVHHARGMIPATRVSDRSPRDTTFLNILVVVPGSLMGSLGDDKHVPAATTQLTPALVLSCFPKPTTTPPYTLRAPSYTISHTAGN